MNKVRFTLRVGICSLVIGVAMFAATIAINKADSYPGSFTAPPNGDSVVNIFTPLVGGQYELRISVSRAFKGTVYVFDYDGMRKLGTEGVKTPVFSEDFQGNTLMDLNLTGKGTYMVMVHSNVTQQYQGTIGLVGLQREDYELIQASITIASVGAALSLAAGVARITHSRLQKRTSSIASCSLNSNEGNVSTKV